MYGTLRAGQAPAQMSWLETLPREPASVPGVLLDLGAYPGFLSARSLPASRVCRVQGELLSVGSSRLPEVDRYEGYVPTDPRGSLFVRQWIVARAAAGDVRCWIYCYNGPPGRFPRIHGGDWLAARPTPRG